MGASTATPVASIERRVLRGPSLTRAALVLGTGAAALVAVLVAAVGLGSVGVGVGDTLAILGHRLLALPLAARPGRPLRRRSSSRSACRAS